VASVAIATALAVAAPTAAGASEGTDPIVLPEGVACSDFEVRLEVSGGKRNTRTFTDADGDIVTMTTGAAESVVLTNGETGESVTVGSRGARTRTTVRDGITTVEQTGNLVLVLFPSDVGGEELPVPSTTFISGRTVFTIDDATGVFTLQQVSGRTTDLCAVLAP
jgi:hypothetical protein